MNIRELRRRRKGMGASQYLTAKLAKISRNRLSLIECGYSAPTKIELINLENAIRLIEGKHEIMTRKLPLKIWNLNQRNIYQEEN